MKKGKFSKKDLVNAFLGGVHFHKKFVVDRFSNLMEWGVKIETPNLSEALEAVIKEIEDGEKK